MNQNIQEDLIENGTARIASRSASDLALRPSYMKFSGFIAIIAIIPSLIILMLVDKIAISGPLIGIWFSACFSWLAGGTARITAVSMDSVVEGSAGDGINLVKRRWFSLFFGYLLFVLALLICIAAIYGLVYYVSGISSVISALLVIPMFFVVLGSLSISLNTYLYCAVTGFEDIGMFRSMKVLTNLCIKAPFHLASMAFDALRTLAPLAGISAILIAIALAITFLVTRAIGVDFISNLDGQSFTDLAGSIRMASLIIIGYWWISYLVNVLTITYAFTYRDSA